MIVKLFINPLNYSLDRLYTKEENEYLIGVDKGAYHALKHGIELDLAIGDFDSTDETETAYIKKHAKVVKTHKARKDETDSYLAIKEALRLNPEEIIVYGGIGSRLDHTYANIALLKQGTIVFMNDKNKMYMLSPGQYDIKNTQTYISFFAIEDVVKLSLTGFSYAITDYDLAVDDPLCVSNKGSGTVSFDEGLLLVMESSD